MFCPIRIGCGFAAFCEFFNVTLAAGFSDTEAEALVADIRNDLNEGQADVTKVASDLTGLQTDLAA